MSKNLQFLFGLNLKVAKKQHDSDEEKENTQKKTTFEDDSGDTIPESVSKLNKVVLYDYTNSDS